MDERISQIADVLLEIEAEMRRIGLWDETPPASEAFESTMPFCYDRLEFEQWLQWVFLPRTRHVVEQGHPLPGESGIHAMAEEVFKRYEAETERLERQLAEFDRIINGE